MTQTVATVVLVHVSFFWTTSLFAQIYDFFSHNLETSFLIQNSTVEELVFEGDKQISKLVWQQYLDPSIRITYNARLQSLFLKAQYTSSIPIKSGILENYDYLSSTDAITHYSNHNLYLDKNFSLQGQLGYMFNFVDVYALKPFVGFTYQNRKFSAQDGYLQYPEISGDEWNASLEKDSVTGVVILYEQAIMYPYVGIDNLFFVDTCMISVYATYLPYVYVDALDSHILRLTQFYDEMRGGYGFTVGTAVSFPLGEKSNIGLKVGFDYEYFNSYGTTSSNVIGINDAEFIVSDNATSGTKNSAYRFIFGVVINPN